MIMLAIMPMLSLMPSYASRSVVGTSVSLLCNSAFSVAPSDMGHWSTCPSLEFANAHKFCRPNVRWLSLLDNFVATNFRTRAPQARAPLEQNSGDATAHFMCEFCVIVICVFGVWKSVRFCVL